METQEPKVITPKDFAAFYGKRRTKAEALVAQEVYGVDAGINGYSTLAQADELAATLRLGPGMLVLDIGAGQGWPGLYLAATTGCAVVLTDVPATGLRAARGRMARQRHGVGSSFARANGAALPFRPHSFDVVVHTDVL